MLELLRPTKDHTENYMADLIDQLEYLFTHVDVNNFTADMREKWEALASAVEAAKKSIAENAAATEGRLNDIEQTLSYIDDDITYLWDKTTMAAIRKVMYPVGACVISSETDAAEINVIYGGNWSAQSVISGNYGKQLFVYERTS